MNKIDDIKNRLTGLYAKKQEAILNDESYDMISLEIGLVEKELTAAKKKADSVKDKQEKDEEKEELTEAEVYQQFRLAKSAMDQYEFGLVKRSCEYFITMTFVDKDRDDPELERYTTEIENYSFIDVGRAFIELSHKTAKAFLRRIVEGGKIVIKNPETDEFEEYEFPRRVYHKLVNTMNIPDKNSYNIVNLENIVKPTAYETECPWILKCLMKALGAGKDENIEYVEKYIYSCSIADIGNNQTPFPVFYGKGKMGKNALFEMVIPAILGKECVFASTWSVIGESGFNQFKLGKVLLFIDEIPERSEWTRIKAWTGGLTEYIKVKYGLEYNIDNIIVLAFGSNEESFPLPFEQGEQMMRVSPLKAGDKTFAEYVYDAAEQLYGPDFIPALLTEKIGVVPDTKHMAGDKFLRNFKDLWIGKEVIQQFVNYLDSKYNPGIGKKFVLMPLRGEDWAELTVDKKDYVHVALDWCMNHNDYVVVQEAFHVYQHMCKVAGRKMIKQWDSFSISASNYLKKKNWISNKQCVVTHRVASLGVVQGQSKTANQRVVVWFKNQGDVIGKVDSLLNSYYSQVSTPNGTTPMLNDILNFNDVLMNQELVIIN